MYQSVSGLGSRSHGQQRHNARMQATTLRAALASLEAQLAAACEQPRREAELLLTAVAGVDRLQLLVDPERELPGSVVEALAEAGARRARGEPLAYICGRRGFLDLDLEVTPAVLVPRPETEGLVERALQCAGAAGSALDLGTGSGAIAIAFASARPGWQVTATDLSAAALEVAARNAERLVPGRLRLLQGRWFEPIGSERFDLAMSNPPYIDSGDPALEDAALRHEPQLALTPGPDGLAALREIVATAPLHLRPNGRLLLEHGASQGAAVRALLEAQGFRHVVSHRDLAGHERVTEGIHAGG